MTALDGAGGVDVTPVKKADRSKRIPESLPKHPTADDVYFIGGAWAPAAITAQEKRFTDAELAAEWHRTASLEFAAMGDPSGYKPGAQQRAAIQRATLERFATLPHYDEDPT